VIFSEVVNEIFLIYSIWVCAYNSVVFILFCQSSRPEGRDLDLKLSSGQIPPRLSTLLIYGFMYQIFITVDTPLSSVIYIILA
jgi:hypothetical protein